MNGWRKIFIGPVRYWLMWPVIVAILYACGRQGLHVRDFISFIFVVLLLAAAVIVFVVMSYRPDEQVTREPFPLDDETGGD